MQEKSKENMENAVLARRLARELAVEEVDAVSGAGAKDTDWSKDYKDTSSTGHTGISVDGRVDF